MNIQELVKRWEEGERLVPVEGLIQQAVLAEREACAQIAEEWLGPAKDRDLHIAAAIRARGEP